MGMWQKQEQSLLFPANVFGEEVSCLLNIEHSSEAQSSSLFPLKQPASPHINKERAKKTAKSK